MEKAIKSTKAGTEVIQKQFDKTIKRIESGDLLEEFRGFDLSAQYIREVNIFIEGLGLGLRVKNVWENTETCHLILNVDD